MVPRRRSRCPEQAAVALPTRSCEDRARGAPYRHEWRSVKWTYSPTAGGRFRMTLPASAIATQAAASAATRSAHHHPSWPLASKPKRARTPRPAPIPLRVPSPLRALLASCEPTRFFARPRGARTSAATAAESIAEKELSGAVSCTRAWTDATVSTVAVTSSAAATTTDASASARSAAAGSKRSRRNRQTRVADPATSARRLSPRPRTPRLPASNPAVMDHIPATRPQVTETVTSKSALRTSASRSAIWGPWAPSRWGIVEVSRTVLTLARTPEVSGPYMYSASSVVKESLDPARLSKQR